MSAETNKLRSTKEILDAIVTALRALNLEQGQPAFDRVEIFDLPDYLNAMQRLALNQERTALVIWTGDEFETNRETIVLTTRRISNFDIFVSERNLANPVAATTGDPEKYLPGVMGLRDLVIPALTGQILASDAEAGKELIYLAPAGVERAILSSEDKQKFPARQILILNFTAAGEWLQVGVEANEAIQ